MGLDGEYRPLVGRVSFFAALVFGLFLTPALAQIVPESPHDNVMRRQNEKARLQNPYWDGFILKRQGDCAGAVVKLAPIARRGRGYENAQTALGECLLELAGLPRRESQPPARAAMLGNATFQEGLDWIISAAETGNFTAQGVLIALYAANLGPDQNKIEGAKWAHLYLTNPNRLNLGAPVLAQKSIDYLQARTDRTSWLQGKQLARDWTPRFTIPQRMDAKKEPNKGTEK